MTLLISTCGTSLLSNLAYEDERKWLTSIANETDGDDRAYGFIARIEHELALQPREAYRRLSAEFNSIQATRAQLPGQRQHLLIHTDTFLGREAARLVSGMVTSSGEGVQLLTVPGLRTNNLASFRLALPELSRELDASYITPFKQTRIPIAFNLTGGFKALLAYLQAFAMLHGLPSYLLFEGAPEAMEIPALPIRLDDEGLLRNQLERFRRLDVGYTLPAREHLSAPRTLFADLGGDLDLTEWGTLIWSRLRVRALGNGPLESLSTKLRVAPALTNSFNDYEPNRRAQANAALDALACHLDTGKPLLKSVTFKQFTSPLEPAMTHALYAWNDGEAGRIMLTREGESYTAYKLRDHLG
jgi:putative CRISPR-associated protein (TIGR02619 family)